MGRDIKESPVKPSCYIEEKDTVYPLCEGRNLTECEMCALWKDLEPEYER